MEAFIQLNFLFILNLLPGAFCSMLLNGSLDYNNNINFNDATLSNGPTSSPDFTSLKPLPKINSLSPTFSSTDNDTNEIIDEQIYENDDSNSIGKASQVGRESPFPVAYLMTVLGQSRGDEETSTPLDPDNDIILNRRRRFSDTSTSNDLVTLHPNSSDNTEEISPLPQASAALSALTTSSSLELSTPPLEEGSGMGDDEMYSTIPPGTTPLRGKCNETSQCFGEHVECRLHICKCQLGYLPRIDNGELCGEASAHHVEVPTTDPTMIGVVVGLALMSVTLCIVLRLFAKARFRENRTIFNTPNPRLMNVSLLKGSKTLLRGNSGGQRSSSRRGSQTSMNSAPDGQAPDGNGVQAAGSSHPHRVKPSRTISTDTTNQESHNSKPSKSKLRQQDSVASNV